MSMKSNKPLNAKQALELITGQEYTLHVSSGQAILWPHPAHIGSRAMPVYLRSAPSLIRKNSLRHINSIGVWSVYAL